MAWIPMPCLRRASGLTVVTVECLPAANEESRGVGAHTTPLPFSDPLCHFLACTHALFRCGHVAASVQHHTCWACHAGGLCVQRMRGLDAGESITSTDLFQSLLLIPCALGLTATVGTVSRCCLAAQPMPLLMLKSTPSGGRHSILAMLCCPEQSLCAHLYAHALWPWPCRSLQMP